MNGNGRQPSDLEELESWVRDHRSDLVGTAYGVLRDRQEAEDVVQDTLLRVWRRAGGRRIERSGAYLSRAVYWNALKHRARRRDAAPLEDAGEGERTGSGEEEWALSGLELEQAIVDLPLAQQTVIRLRFYLGFTFQEIGAALSVSTNTAASRCRYALARLRGRLADDRPGRAGSEKGVER